MEGSLSWGSIRGGRKDLSGGDLSEGDGSISLVGIYPKDLSCGDLSEGDGRISLVGIYPWKEFSRPTVMEESLSWGSIRRGWKDLSRGDLSEGDCRGIKSFNLLHILLPIVSALLL